MHILRAIVVWISSISFRFLLFSGAFVIILAMVFSTPVPIKKALKENNVYSTFMDAMIAQLKSTPQNNQSSGTLSFSDPIIQQDIKSAFPPQFLEASTENVIDGTYHWLNGKTAQPDFSINFMAEKQQLANSLGDYVVAKLSVLPLCTRAQLRQLTQPIDPLTAPCRPANLDVTAQKQQTVNDLMNNKDFLSNTLITASSIPKDKNGNTFFEQQRVVPKIYSWFRYSAPLLSLAVIIFALLIIFFHRGGKRMGLRNIGTALLSSGAILLATSLVALWFYRHANKSGGSIDKLLSEGGSFQLTISRVLDALSKLINERLIWFGIGYLAVGLIILLILLLTRPKKEAPTDPVASLPDQRLTQGIPISDEHTAPPTMQNVSYSTKSAEEKSNISDANPS